MRSALRQRAAEPFRANKHLYYYAHSKILLDPSYPCVTEALKDSPLPLLDIGCGMGLLGSLLRAAGHSAPIIGLDADGAKAREGANYLRLLNITLQEGDARQLPPHSGDVVMLDVLHYFTDEEQTALLSGIADRLAPGGRAFVRVTIRDDSWRYRMTLAEEWFVSTSRWIPFKGSNFPRRETLQGPFLAAGCECRLIPMWGYTPFNSYMLEASRPATSAR